MLKVAITGLTGFVGTNLKKHLSSCEIAPLSVRYQSTQSFKIVENAIIHLAGKAHDLKNRIQYA